MQHRNTVPGLRALAAPLLAALLALLAIPQTAAAEEPKAEEAPQAALARSARAMVVSPHPVATRAGLTALRAGGNAVDAAVAAAFALSVAQPQSTGVGGGMFMLMRLAPDADASADAAQGAREIALDARETAPAAATPEMFLAPGLPERASIHGGLASGTPGFVAGLALASESYGRLPLAEVLAPAIQAAEEGVPLGEYQLKMVQRFGEQKELRARFPETARIQWPQNATAETVKKQPELARTLRAIAEGGPRAFYEGEIAQAIVAAAGAHGGILTLEDLRAYRPELREPVRGEYRGLQILGFPPPSSGGVTLLQILNIIEGFDLRGSGAGSALNLHRISEAMKLAFADRAVHLGDPAFAEIPVARLLSRDYAAKLRARVGRRAAEVQPAAPPPQDGGTAHLSVLDSEGNAVALTGTINGSYGSLVTVPKWGILLNNEMDDFVADPAGKNMFGLAGRPDSLNLVAPGKRPLSSMSPLIALENERVRFIAGSNGGPRIITSTLLTFLHHVEWGMDAAQAVSYPRFHHQWLPNRLDVEAATPPQVVQALRARGHEVRVREIIPTGVQLIVADGAREITGASDPRRDGLAEGL